MDEQLFTLRPARSCIPTCKLPEAISDTVWYKMLVPFAIPGFRGHRVSLMTRLTSSCRCRMELWLSGKMS